MVNPESEEDEMAELGTKDDKLTAGDECPRCRRTVEAPMHSCHVSRENYPVAELAAPPPGLPPAPGRGVDVRALDVGQLNDAAAVLWDEAHRRGARAGDEKARTEMAMEHCERLLDLARMLIGAAVGAEAESAHRRRYARFARIALGRTPGMVDLKASLSQLDAALEGAHSAPVSGAALAGPATAIEEAHEAAQARLAELRAAGR